MKNIIEVKNLYKKYGDLEAVKGISFEVHKNEIFGILGPNGAGKTTTLEIMETLKSDTKKNGSTIKIDGISIHKNPFKIKSMIGVQLQSAGFHEQLKLKEILNLFASLYNSSINAKELLAKVKLEDKAKSKVNDLSGGQKQRFSIATTLVHKPKVIFLDEPSTGLDPQARRNLWELIKSIRDDGTTIVLTTHFMDEAEYLCERVAIMDEGKILKIDTPDNLVNELISNGFSKPKPEKAANLEDVFLDLTGKELRE